MPDPWAVLGLPRDAPWDDVRAAHRRLAKELHPDVAGTDTDHRRMAEVNAAFALLAAQIPRTGGPDLRNSSIHAASSHEEAVDEAVGFSIDLLPAEAFEALLIVCSFLGDPWVIDEPYELTALFDPPLACRCNMWLVPEAGGSIVTIDVHPVRAYPTPTREQVRDALVVELVKLDGPPR